MGHIGGVISATFRCKVCGADAETVRFMVKGTPGNYCTGDAINYDSGSETRMLEGEEIERVRRALESSDAEALYEVHHRYLPTYCPKCEACYCKDHWKVDSHPDPNSDSYSMHYDTYGTCPAHHRRLMAKDSYYWPEDE